MPACGQGGSRARVGLRVLQQGEERPAAEPGGCDQGRERDGVAKTGHRGLAGKDAVLWLTAAAAGVAASHWSLRRLRFERRIRMTPQEFADEARSMQADPKIRLMHQPRRQVAGTA